MTALEVEATNVKLTRARDLQLRINRMEVWLTVPADRYVLVMIVAPLPPSAGKDTLGAVPALHFTDVHGFGGPPAVTVIKTQETIKTMLQEGLNLLKAELAAL